MVTRNAMILKNDYMMMQHGVILWPYYQLITQVHPKKAKFRLLSRTQQKEK